MAADILTLTLNAMVKKRLWISSFALGAIHRANRVECNAGGKGVNVARQLLRLGNSPLAMVCAGGHTASHLSQLLDQEQLPHHIFLTPEPLREGWTIYDENGAEIGSFFEPSAPLPENILAEIQSFLRHKTPAPRWLACCGSAPDDASATFYRHLIEQAQKNGLLTALDTYGKALRESTGASPTLVKINAQEAAQFLGASMNGLDDFKKLQTRFLKLGIRYLVVTDGNKPFFGAHDSRIWKVTPPEVEALNPTGSGDAMLAGLLSGLGAAPDDFPSALRLGTAAGACNAARYQVSNTPLEEVQKMISKVMCSAVE